MPRMPSVAPCTSLPVNMSYDHFVHSPRRRKCSLSAMRRAAAIISAKPKSAVVSVSTSGVLVASTPRAVQAGNVEVVVAHRHVGHHAQLGAGGQHLGIDALAAGGQGALLALQALHRAGSS